MKRRPTRPLDEVLADCPELAITPSPFVGISVRASLLESA